MFSFCIIFHLGMPNYFMTDLWHQQVPVFLFRNTVFKEFFANQQIYFYHLWKNNKSKTIFIIKFTCCYSAWIFAFVFSSKIQEQGSHVVKVLEHCSGELNSLSRQIFHCSMGKLFNLSPSHFAACGTEPVRVLLLSVKSVMVCWIRKKLSTLSQ